MRLIRYKCTAKGCFGVLKDDNGGTYFTCENPDKRIPVGKYSVKISYSPKFETKLPLVYSDSVSQSRGIRIHQGNSKNDSSGCILVGNTADLTLMRIGYSVPALAQLMKSCGNELVIEEL